ncbi:MAG: ABC transporter permease [Vagococcus fluvialis]
MIRYTLRRLLDVIPTLLLVIVIVFIITRLIPGDPASTMLGPQASVEEVAKLRESLGLDKSLISQFWDYMNGLFHFDLGTSFTYRKPVMELIIERLPNTLILAAMSLIIALVLGVLSGIISAVKKDTFFDYFFTVISLVGVSIPVFWLGLMLVLLFSVTLGWLPATGMGNMKNGFLDYFSHLILPSLTLATIPMANFSRITRSSMLEVMNQNYIKTARAKGVGSFSIVMKHGLKNAATPILTVLGMQLSSMLSGAVLTETIYSWPGMGRLIVDAINKRDFIVVQGTVLFLALMYVLINLLVDILYKVVNPRVSLENGGTKK